MHRRTLALSLFLLGAVALVLPACGGRAAKRAPASAGPESIAQWERPARLAGVAAATRLDVPIVAAADGSPPACDDRCDESDDIAASRPDGGAPKTRATRIRFETGMTLYALSRAYDVPLRTLMQVNGITDPTTIRSGTMITIPGDRQAPRARAGAPRTSRSAKRPRVATPAGPPASPGPAAVKQDPPALKPDPPSFKPDPPAVKPAPPAVRLDSPAVRLDPPVASPEPPVSAEPAATPGIMSIAWPLEGRITGPFGARGQRHHHDGIDIDGVRGEEIRAVAEGVVVRAGVEGKYGRTVVLDHGNGMTTLYAHAHRLFVREGDLVEQGEAIAEVGSTGNARGTHLHFEVRRDGRPVDPLPYLKPEMMGAAPR